MTRMCPQCGAQFTASSYRARYCGSTCRKRAQRARSAPGTPSPASVPTSTVPDAQRADSVAESVAKVLADRGLESTPQGRVAMKLAMRLDNSSDTDTAAGTAALAGKLCDLLDKLGARPQSDTPDPIDRLQARYQARLTAAPDLAG